MATSAPSRANSTATARPMPESAAGHERDHIPQFFRTSIERRLVHRRQFELGLAAQAGARRYPEPKLPGQHAHVSR